MVNMSDYTPPFSISNKMLGFVSSISEKIGKISNYNDFESKPQLRKNNRIKSIYSSLAIEANSLSISEVRAFKVTTTSCEIGVILFAIYLPLLSISLCFT